MVVHPLKPGTQKDKGCKGCEDANCKVKDDKEILVLAMLSLRCLYNVSIECMICNLVIRKKQEWRGRIVSHQCMQEK